jgi:hypothetical protein
MGVSFWFEAKVIWGAEIHLTAENFGILIKYLYAEERQGFEFIEKVAGSELAYKWWHSDDGRLQKYSASSNC